MNNFWCNILPVVVGLGGAWIGGLIGWYMRRSRIAELQSQVDDKESENLHLKNNNEMMGIRLENFQNEYTRASANLNTLEDKYTTLQNEYAVLGTANRVLSSQLEEANNSLNEMKNQPATIIEENRNMPSEGLLSLQSDIEQRNSHITILENKYAELEKAHQLLLTQYGNREIVENTEGVAHSDVSQALETRDIAINEIETKYYELENAFNQLQSDYDKRGNRIAEIYASKEEWRQAFIDMETKVDALEARLGVIQSEPVQNNEWEQSFHDLNKKYHTLAEEFEGLMEKNKHWEEAFTQLDNEYSVLVTQSKEIQNTAPVEKADSVQIEYLEAQNEKLQQEIEAIKADATAKEQQLTEMHKVSSNLWQKRYTNILNEIDEYKSELMAFKSTQANFDEKTKEWEAMYDELVVAFQETNEAYRLLQEKNSQYEEKIAELEHQTMAISGVIAEPEPTDDLKIIEGVGPKIEDVLKKAGILTFEQLSKTPSEEISAILDAAGSQFKMHDPTTWSAQAELAAKQEWEQLKAYQDYLMGGRDTGSN